MDNYTIYPEMQITYSKVHQIVEQNLFLSPKIILFRFTSIIHGLDLKSTFFALKENIFMMFDVMHHNHNIALWFQVGAIFVSLSMYVFMASSLSILSNFFQASHFIL